MIIKPLQGSGGKNVFKIEGPDDSNINQIFEAVSEEGYMIAQGYMPKAKDGDVRVFVMNGTPLEQDGKYGPCCIDQLQLRARPTRDGIQAVRSKLGWPSPVIQLRTRTPILASVF